MTATSSSFTSPADGTSLATFSWEEVAEPRGIVQIAHGIAEHALRYDRLAKSLTAAGYRVHANDHRGHGRSVTSAAGLGHFGEPGFPGLVADVAAYGRCRLVELLDQRYQPAGVLDVRITIYPGARHEIFNETNRDEVTADVVAWLHARD